MVAINYQNQRCWLDQKLPELPSIFLSTRKMPKNKLLRNQKLKAITVERAEKFVSKDYWKDVNLWSKLYKKRQPDCVRLSVYSVPNTDVNHTDKMSYKEAMEQEFVPVKVGQSYGPSWSTHWFKGFSNSIFL